MGTEHAILLLNHSYEVDWLFSWFICEHVKMLGVCIIDKIELFYLPFDKFFFSVLKHL